MPKPIPDGLHSLTAQLNVDGAAAAIDFYKRAFGAQERHRAVDPSGQKIWHAELGIGNSALFVNDVFPQMGAPANVTNLWLYVDGVDAAFERAVAAGATVKMPLSNAFWGDRMGVLADAWGNQWTLAQRIQDMTHDEMQAAQDAFVQSMKKPG